MKKEQLNILKRIIKIILTNVFVVLVPLSVFFLLKAEGNILITILFMGLINCLFIIYAYGRGIFQKISFFLLLGVLLFYSALLLLKTVLISYSLYEEWFRLYREEGIGGAFPFLFVDYMAFFTSIFTGLMHKNGYLKPFSGLILSLVLIFTVIYQSIEWALFLTSLLILNVFLLIAVKKKEKRMINRMGFTVGLLAVVFILAWPFSQSLQPEGVVHVWPAIHTFVNNIVLKIVPDFPVLIAAPGYGTSFEHENIGYRPILTENPILKVSSSFPGIVYLRTRAFDFYTGKGWITTEQFLDTLSDKQDMSLELPDEQAVPLDITILLELYQFIPHTLPTVSVTFDSDVSLDFKYFNKDVGIILNKSILKGTSYTIWQNKKLSGKPEELTEEELSFYLSLPPNVSENMMVLAEELSLNTQDNLEVIKSIRSYLAKNYRYSLEVNDPGEEENNVEHFLFKEGKGYCAHFASACVILARLNGIPARYVTGYLVIIPPGTDSVIVPGLSSHAWAEIWLPEYGWTTWEVTPPMQPEYYGNPYFYDLFNLEGDSYTRRQLETILGNMITQEEEKQKIIRLEPLITGFIVLMICGILVFIVIQVVKHQLKHHSTYRGIKRRFQKVVLKLVLKLKKRGIPSPESIGWKKWGIRTLKLYPAKSAVINEGVDLIQKIFFSPALPAPDDIVKIRNLFK